MDDVYEEPVNPDLRIDTRDVTAAQAADLVMWMIESPAPRIQVTSATDARWLASRRLAR